jgi:6-phosphogluconolactonase (cycloisomerase 2 family)
MKNLTEISTALALIAAGVAAGPLRLQAQDTAPPHYVITNDDLYRTPSNAAVFQLHGSSLVAASGLSTGGWGIGGTYFGTSGQAVAKMGSNVCVFVADPGSDDIAAFNAGDFTSPVKVGNYADPSGSGAYLGLTLATRGAMLFAGYTASVNIGMWTINSDCSLALASAASNTPTPAPVDQLAVSPDGHTLVATFGQSEPGIGSYAVSGSTLTPKGPYNTAAGAAGVDITKDSKYALIGDFGGTFPQIEVFPINSDSSLGSGTAYSFPQGGVNSNNVALSPDETRLYVNNNSTGTVTMLSFSEAAPVGKQLQFMCITDPLTPSGSFLAYTSGVSTSATTGTGGYLYVILASYNPSFVLGASVALLKIPTGTGCPAPVAGSPYALAAGSEPTTLSAYPPRPF